MNENQSYTGVEVGPIRPPSEANSLLLRITRNCPWNKCKFCGLYKGEKFSARPTQHVLEDIAIIKQCIDVFEKGENDGRKTLLHDLQDKHGENGHWAYYTAMNWYNNGMESIFLQDANSMVVKPEAMIEILETLRKYFPDVERITTYARSQTISKISDENLQRMADAGLNRIHIGMESASDKVLELVKKGVDKATHILGGKKVKKAGIELSEYYMPGLGGNEYSEQNAIQTADAINQINPDFIRIRTLALPDQTELADDYKKGVFTRTNDVKMVEELLLFVENLDGITSTLKSDHILNLLQDVEGKFPEDKPKMIRVIKDFLALNKTEQLIFRLGRRSGVMKSLSDLHNPKRRQLTESIMSEYNINESNIDMATDARIKQFI
ncbi:MAG: radical SAM protein [Okeania sp. SIO3C4]|nr:radical SAM protein [Okeania sp. SIO3C4]